MNISLAEKVLMEVARYGVREFCVCAGARNSPIVFCLSQSSGATIHNFFDERSAGFFALGRIQQSGKPVAVVTTSGTAVAELLPATVEAHYSDLPLVLITADRPREYRGTGAPQSIEQVGIFSHYVQTTQDVAFIDEQINLEQWSRKTPFHINVCFKEPLIDQEVPKIQFQNISELPKIKTALSAAGAPAIENPLVIVGSLKSDQQAPTIELLKKLKAPIYAEAISGLRGRRDISDLVLRGGERSVQKIFENKFCKSVLRIGGIPTLRFWRDLEDKYKDVPVFSVSDNDFTGLSRRVNHLVGFQNLNLLHLKSQSSIVEAMKLDQQLSSGLVNILNRFPHAEPTLVANLLNKINRGSVYVGNSMPIREVDLVLSPESKINRWLGNRGANGIDGQVSTFLGWSDSSSENWCLLGDLTALYDLSALWITKAIGNQKRRIVVINNSGGLIFKNIFKNEMFLNRHEISFQKWAEMWGWSYQKWTTIPASVENLPENLVIELVPSETESDQFWTAYNQL